MALLLVGNLAQGSTANAQNWQETKYTFSCRDHPALLGPAKEMRIINRKCHHVEFWVDLKTLKVHYRLGKELNSKVKGRDAMFFTYIPLRNQKPGVNTWWVPKCKEVETRWQPPKDGKASFWYVVADDCDVWRDGKGVAEHRQADKDWGFGR
ncbi:hypothetical protein [Streptomyces smyrnaeus]|uniref:hypothetical protein n=1 Tax=Streptomyces smyrnaeus TaxID=1387713 RepID=UPI00340E8E57